MQFGVNLLTKIFRDTHTPRYQRQAISLTVLTDVPREHLYAQSNSNSPRERHRIYLP